MHRTKGLGPERALVLGAATLLLGDTFVPWQRTQRGTFSYSWNAWHGDKGIALGALTALVVAWAVARAAGLALPARAREAAVMLALASLVLPFAVVKNIRDDDSAWGSYLGVAVAVALVAASWQQYRRGVAGPSAAESV